MQDGFVQTHKKGTSLFTAGRYSASQNAGKDFWAVEFSAEYHCPDCDLFSVTPGELVPGARGTAPPCAFRRKQGVTQTIFHAVLPQ